MVHWTVALKGGLQHLVHGASEVRHCICMKSCHGPLHPFSQQQSLVENSLLMYYTDCFPERSALFSKTEFRCHFFLSPIMFMGQRVRSTMSSFHLLTSSPEIAPHTSRRSASSQKCVTWKEFFDHLLHLLLVNNGVFIHLDCSYLEKYSL